MQRVAAVAGTADGNLLGAEFGSALEGNGGLERLDRGAVEELQIGITLRLEDSA